MRNLVNVVIQYRNYECLLIVLIFIQPVLATSIIHPPLTLSAAEVVQAALLNDLSAQSARSSLILQDFSVDVAMRDFLPKLTLSGSAQRHVSGVDPSAGSLRTQTLSSADVSWLAKTGALVKITKSVNWQQSGATSLTVAQPLLRRFGSDITLAQLLNAQSSLRVATSNLRRSALQVVASAISTYTTVVQATSARVQAQQAYALAQRVHQFNQAMVAAGRSPAILMLQSDGDLAAAKFGVAQTENSERLAIRALEKTMGNAKSFQGVTLMLTEDFNTQTVMTPNDTTLFVTEVVAQSHELLVAREAVLVAQRELDAADNNLLPSLDAVLSRTVPSSVQGSTQRIETFVGFNFEVSFDTTQRKFSKSAAQTNLDLAQAQLSEAMRQIPDAAFDAVQAHAFALAQNALAVSVNQLAAKQQEAQVVRQQLGQVSQLELSSAQRSVSATSAQMRDTAAQVVRTRVELDRLDGTLLKKWNVESIVNGWIVLMANDVATR